MNVARQQAAPHRRLVVFGLAVVQASLELQPLPVMQI